MNYIWKIGILVVLAFNSGFSQSEILNDVRAQCNQANASFDILQGCICNDREEHFFFDLQMNKGICKKQKPYSEDFSCKSLVSDCVFYADVGFNVDSIFPSFSGGVLEIRFDNDENRRNYLNKLEEFNASSRYINSWHPISGYHPIETMIVEMGENYTLPKNGRALRNTELGLDTTYLSENRVTDSANNLGSSNIKFYAADEASLYYMLGLETGREILENAIPSNSFSGNIHQNVIAKGFNKYLDSLDVLSDENLWEATLIRGDSCFDVCHLSTKLGKVDGFDLNIYQEIVRGKVRKRFINLVKKSNSDNAVDILIQLTPNNYPSYIVNRMIERNFDETVLYADKIYDKNGRLLFVQEDEVLTSETANFIGENKLSKLDESMPAMFTCEGTSMSGTISPSGYDSHIVFGPESTFFGWTSGDGSIKEFLTPLYGSSFGGLSAGIDKETGHMRKVAESASEVDENIRILPLGAKECISHYDKWRGSDSSAHVKVISISQNYFYTRDSQACHQNLADKILKNDLLWVVAAGNDGIKNPSGADCWNTQQFPNVLVVAAGSESGIANYSNYGLEHADIVADGLIGNSEGASFAAPRVAAMAARLANKYKSLMPAQLKMAILLGAKYDSRLSNLVRSSTFFEFDGADRLKN